MTIKKQPKRKALGRGMSALIDSSDETSFSVGKTREKPDENEVRRVPIEEVQPMSGQPRTRFGVTDIEELAQSIREKGILQPVLVRRSDSGYQIIAGERRWRAAGEAKIKTIPVIIKDVDESEAYQLALIENIQREDLNPVDVGRAFRKLMDDFGLTQEEIAERVGKSRSSVANHLRLLSLPELIRKKVEDGGLSFGHARALAGLPEGLLHLIDMPKLLAGTYSVRELETLIARLKKRKKTPKTVEDDRRRGESAQIRFLRRQLEQRLHLKVTLNDRGGRGRLSIQYGSLDELDGLLRLLGVGG